jgi:hypothetical protein
MVVVAVSMPLTLLLLASAGRDRVVRNNVRLFRNTTSAGLPTGTDDKVLFFDILVSSVLELLSVVLEFLLTVVWGDDDRVNRDLSAWDANVRLPGPLAQLGTNMLPALALVWCFFVCFRDNLLLEASLGRKLHGLTGLLHLTAGSCLHRRATRDAWRRANKLGTWKFRRRSSASTKVVDLSPELDTLSKRLNIKLFKILPFQVNKNSTSDIVLLELLDQLPPKAQGAHPRTYLLWWPW